jgi:serine/threonine protein phosphatase 1
MRRQLIVHQSIPRNPSGRDWVCGDLHGRFEVLMEALDDVSFNPDEDRLFLLGDLIDRGPQSRELLSWALHTDNVRSVVGNHELVFVGGAGQAEHRRKHRAIGGRWADEIDYSQYRVLSTGCANSFPLSMTLECETGTLGLVHAQTPVDDWRELTAAPYSDQLAIDCTWPWTRATGPEKTVTGVTAVVSGHIGTKDIVIQANQIWIDTLAASGKLTLMTAEDLLKLLVPDEHS